MSIATREEAAPATLDDLAASIRSEHEQALRHAWSVIEHAIRAGDGLLAARELIPHGEWEDWLVTNCPAVAGQAQLYQRLAHYRDAIAPGADTLFDAMKSLKGLPAFDGSGPSAHPPEVREEALRLITEEGMSHRMAGEVVGVSRKVIQRWASGDPNTRDSRDGFKRMGRPGARERKERARAVANAKQAIGPAALAGNFRAVWNAHREGQRRELAACLDHLAQSATSWAEQLRAVVEGDHR